MIRVQAKDALSWQTEIGRLAVREGPGCGTGASSGRSKGVGAGGGAGGSSGGDGQGQSGQMTVHMGVFLAVRVVPKLRRPDQRTVNTCCVMPPCRKTTRQRRKNT